MRAGDADADTEQKCFIADLMRVKPSSRTCVEPGGGTRPGEVASQA